MLNFEVPPLSFTWWDISLYIFVARYFIHNTFWRRFWLLVLTRLVGSPLTWQGMKMGALIVPQDCLTVHNQVSGDYLEYLSFRLRNRRSLSVYCVHIRLVITICKGSPSIIILFIALKSRLVHLHPLKIPSADYTLRAFASASLILTCSRLSYHQPTLAPDLAMDSHSAGWERS